MRAVVIDGLRRLAQNGFVSHRAAGVGIAIEAREIAAGDFQAHAMAFEEHVTGYAGIDRHVVDLAGSGELGFSSEFR